MIYESSFWKNDLIKIANKLELRLIQTRWGDKNLYTLEKEIFLGFYSIRKLIESKKVSDSLKTKIYDINEFPYQGDTESIITHFKVEDYDLSKGKKASITIGQLCNQFIHSHHFLPFLPNGKNLIGFFFCSDNKRKSCIYFISIFDIVDIYRCIGNNHPNTLHLERSANNKPITTIE